MSTLDITDAFKKYNVAIYRYFYSRTNNNKELSQDLTQDVFTKAWHKKATFNNDKANLKTWLYSIAKNTLIDYYRKKATRSNSIELDDEIKDNLKDIRSDDKQYKDELFDFVVKKMQYLNEEERELITQKYVDQLEIKEISKLNKKSSVATRVALFRALNKLKKIVNE